MTILWFDTCGNVVQRDSSIFHWNGSGLGIWWDDTLGRAASPDSVTKHSYEANPQALRPIKALLPNEDLWIPAGQSAILVSSMRLERVMPLVHGILFTLSNRERFLEFSRILWASWCISDPVARGFYQCLIASTCLLCSFLVEAFKSSAQICRRCHVLFHQRCFVGCLSLQPHCLPNNHAMRADDSRATCCYGTGGQGWKIKSGSYYQMNFPPRFEYGIDCTYCTR